MTSKVTAVFLGIAVLSWTALLLAGLGVFHPGWALFSAFSAVIFCFLYSGSLRANEVLANEVLANEGSRACKADRRLNFAAIALAGLSVFLSLPPSEMLLGGWDPGVYVHTAAAVSREGSLRIPAHDFLNMDSEVLQVFSRDVGNARQPFLGMYLRPDGYIAPQFFHLFPSLMAVFYGIGGLRMALLLNPLLQGVCVWLFYQLLHRSFPTARGRWLMFGTLIMAIHPVQLWQAGFPTAELLTQALLLFGCIFLLEASRENARFPALLAGFAFGLAFLCRYDVMLFLVPFLLVIVFMQLLPGAPRYLLWTLPGLGITSLHVWLHIRFVAPYYYPLSNLVLPGLAACLLLSAGLVIARTFFGRVTETISSRLYAISGKAAMAVYVIWMSFIVYIRPRLAVDGRVRSAFERLWPGDVDALVNLNVYNAERLGAVFGLPALTLGLIGIAALLFSVRKPAPKAMLFAAVAVMGFLMYDVFHDQFMMWVMRRFVPVILPLICLGIITVLHGLDQRLHRICRLTSWRDTLCSAGLALLLLMPMLPATKALYGQGEWPGLEHWLADVNRHLPEDAVLFCDQPGFAAPFRFMYGHRAYMPVVRGLDDQDHFEAFLLQTLQTENSIFLLSLRDPPDIEGVTIKQQHAFPLTSSILFNPQKGIPGLRRGRGGEFVLYELYGGFKNYD